MIHRPNEPKQRFEAEARDIAEASNSHVRAYGRRGIMERWLFPSSCAI